MAKLFFKMLAIYNAWKFAKEHKKFAKLGFTFTKY